MNLLENVRVREYVSSLNGTNTSPYVCRCLQKDPPAEDVHSEFAQLYSDNMVQLAASEEVWTMNSMVMYITKTSYFGANTMNYLIDSMLKSKDIVHVYRCYSVLQVNISMHPPCAVYMRAEYEKLMLIPYQDNFKGMAIWDYLICYLNRIKSGSYLYGDSEVFDAAFNKFFCLCVDILNADFDASQKYNFKALVMKCLKINPERKTRMNEITTLLDKLFNTGYNIQLPVVKLALLINKFR